MGRCKWGASKGLATRALRRGHSQLIGTDFGTHRAPRFCLRRQPTRWIQCDGGAAGAERAAFQPSTHGARANQMRPHRSEEEFVTVER